MYNGLRLLGFRRVKHLKNGKKEESQKQTNKKKEAADGTMMKV